MNWFAVPPLGGVRRAADENLPWDRLPACQGAHLTGWKLSHG